MDEVTNRIDRVGLVESAQSQQAAETPADELIRRVKVVEDVGSLNEALALLKAAEKAHTAPLHTVIQCDSTSICHCRLERQYKRDARSLIA